MGELASSRNGSDLMPAWLTIQEVADTMGVCTETVYRMVGRGDLAAVRLGRGPRPRIRIPRENLSPLGSDKTLVRRGVIPGRNSEGGRNGCAN
jgi:excisionase family DNA binding protein